MQKSSAVLETVSIGVDWMTATVRRGVKATLIMQVVEQWFEDRQNDGYQGSAWKWNGYSGSTTDGISFGRREDGYMIRLSGDVALNHWRMLAKYSDNISRLDLQVTGLDDDKQNDWTLTAKHTSQHEARILAGMTRTTLIMSTPSGSTYSIGSRASDRYLRIYNKTAESGGIWPDTCWRWEIEYKAGLADKVAERLLTTENTDHLILSRVWQDFNQWLITVPCPSVGPGWRPMKVREESSDQKRLQWLRRCIRPMVDKMSQSYDVDTLSQALGFHWVTDDLSGVGAVYLLHGDTLRIDETGDEPLE
jgi:DNA relaxase NicK